MTLRYDPEYDAKIADLYSRGLSTYQVSARLGVSQGMVAKALRRAGTPRRSMSDAQFNRYSKPTITLRLPPGER